jgi:hypothetical protein
MIKVDIIKDLAKKKNIDFPVIVRFPSNQKEVYMLTQYVDVLPSGPDTWSLYGPDLTEETAGEMVRLITKEDLADAERLLDGMRCIQFSIDVLVKRKEELLTAYDGVLAQAFKHRGMPMPLDELIAIGEKTLAAVKEELRIAEHSAAVTGQVENDG